MTTAVEPLDTYGPRHIGKRSDWVERDNFPDLDNARGYAKWKHSQYPRTSYRIVHRLRPARFAVEYVPDWKVA